ncbi:reverse transcriptase domain-containing protein [Tanacetum coccineum]
MLALREANAIETIAIYEAKTRVACNLMNRVERQKDKVAENASNKRKWEGYAGNLPLCNKCKFHHTGLCAAKCGNSKRVGHQTRDCRTPIPRANQRPSMAKQKAEVICYECRRLGHYKNGCPEKKNQNQVNKQWKGKIYGDSSVMANNVNV